MHLYDEAGEIRPHVLCFLNGISIRWLHDEDPCLSDGDRIKILQAVSGGAVPEDRPRRIAERAAGYEPADRYVLFELGVEQAVATNLLAADDVALHMAAMRAHPWWRGDGRLLASGVGEAAGRALVEAFTDALDGQRLTREQLATAVSRRAGASRSSSSRRCR